MSLAASTGWLALILLARVTPALFPGQSLPLGTSLPAALDVLEVESPGEGSVFNRPIVILVAAVDARPHNGNDMASINTDTIMLARIDPVAKDVRVLSIPRDLLVTVSYPGGSRGLDRVNTSFAIGASEGNSSSKGMEHLRGDLEREFGLQIDYWVQVDFHGAERLIDAVGGIDVHVPPELAFKNWWYSDDDVTHELLSLPAGRRHLNGYESVAFARFRETDDDLHRIQRQQIVLEAAVSAAFAGDSADDPVGFWQAYSSAVKTNVPRSRMPGLAMLMAQTRGAFSTYSLADSVAGEPTLQDRVLRSGAAVLVGDPERVSYWLELVFGPGSVQRSASTGSVR